MIVANMTARGTVDILITKSRGWFGKTSRLSSETIRAVISLEQGAKKFVSAHYHRFNDRTRFSFARVAACCGSLKCFMSARHSQNSAVSRNDGFSIWREIAAAGDLACDVHLSASELTRRRDSQYVRRSSRKFPFENKSFRELRNRGHRQEIYGLSSQSPYLCPILCANSRSSLRIA